MYLKQNAGEAPIFSVSAYTRNQEGRTKGLKGQELWIGGGEIIYVQIDRGGRTPAGNRAEGGKTSEAAGSRGIADAEAASPRRGGKPRGVWGALGGSSSSVRQTGKRRGGND